MVGVAPDATLYAYKTTNCFSNGVRMYCPRLEDRKANVLLKGDDTLLDALQRAYDDDVVSDSAGI
jgi:hypothetical protein